MGNLAVQERRGAPEVAGGEAPARGWPAAVAAYLAIGAVLWLVVWLSATYLPREELYPTPGRFFGGTAFEGWIRWDAHWYRAIVEEGYVYYPGVQSSVAFFPAYPMLMWLVARVVPDVFLAGVLVTIASGITAAAAFRAWCAHFVSPRAAWTALLLLLLYPYAWYLYGAVYADTLCLAAMLVAFVALERDRPWIAGVAAFVAAAARPVGLVFAVALALRALERRNADRIAAAEGRPFPVRLAARFSLRGLRRADLGVLLGFGGFAAYAGYLWARFDDPFLFATIQSVPGWDQGEGPSTWFKFFLLSELWNKAHSPFVWGKLAQGLVAIALLALVPRIARRFGWAYAAYTLGVLALPIVGTKDFAGTGRYLLAVFPCFALAGDWLVDRPRVRLAALTASGLLLVFLASAFARGHYLS